MTTPTGYASTRKCTCWACSGGLGVCSRTVACGDCLGRGVVLSHYEECGFGEVWEPCPECRGTGVSRRASDEALVMRLRHGAR